MEIYKDIQDLVVYQQFYKVKDEIESLKLQLSQLRKIVIDELEKKEEKKNRCQDQVIGKNQE